ncbi:MAG: hypothetical protein QOF43_2478, partial [Gaiellaceae bacterium]|nr:hypothetical protein [Gaiellaceae bacterium]
MQLICVHGLSGSTKWWSAVLPDLERRFDVHVLDLRKVRPRDGAAWIAGHIAALDRPVLVGHSLGG